MRSGGAIRRVVMVAVAGLVALCSTPSADAAVRTVTIGYDRPEQPRSLNPTPPITQQSVYPQALTVAYDDVAGTLAVHVALYDAAYWANVLPSVDLAFHATCGEDGSSPSIVNASFDYEAFADTDENGNPTRRVYSNAKFRHKDYDGIANGTITPAADGFDVAYQHTALVGIEDLRCVNVELPSRFSGHGYFAGFEPFVLTQDNAGPEFRRLLGERFGREFTGASHVWAICPKEEFFAPVDNDEDGEIDDGLPAAGCMAHFKGAGGKWRVLSARLEEDDDGAVLATKPWTRTWTRKWRKQGPSCLREAHVRGTIVSNDGTCPARMVSDAAAALRQHPSRKRIPYVGWYGTNLAGFEKVAGYRCRRSGRTVTCRNGVGDAWRWTR